MSTIEVTTASEIGKVTLPRRITELMHEKGDAYTIRGFSQRLGISREYLRIMLTGERAISPAMTQKIVQGLGITVERLTQTDTIDLVQDLTTILGASKRTKPMLIRAFELATRLVNVAMGATERAVSLNNLGRVQFFQQKYDDAHATWLRALEFAKVLHEEHDEKDLLHLITTNLMLTYTIRNEYSHAEEILELVEQVFPANPSALGLASYTRMQLCLARRKFIQARTHALQSLEYHQQTKDAEQIGKAFINLAHCESQLENYEQAATSLTSAISFVKNFDFTLIFAVVEYVKTLVKLQKHDEASYVIEQYTSLAKSYPEYYGKLRILYTKTKDDPSFASQISDDSTFSMQIRYHACKCLFEFYRRKGDAETALMYYERARIYSNSKAEFFEEEGF